MFQTLGEKMFRVFDFSFIFVFLFIGCGSDFSEYDVLLDPKINQKPDQTMLVYEITGDPNLVGEEAFSALFKAFYKMKSEYQLVVQAPKAQWPKLPDTPKHEWVGVYGLPVTSAVKKIPDALLKEYPKLRLETWQYGMVGEILHIGSYTSEGPTVKRLHNFIESQGYKISGNHEEEYLKGPGVFLRGNPDRYKTIIRYAIQKK